MNQNVTNMTFGAVDPKGLFDTNLAKLEASATVAAIATVPTPFGPVRVGTYSVRLVVAGLGGRSRC